MEAAGRDHAIIRETATGHEFLFPMIYFDYAEFAGPVKYFPQETLKFKKSSVQPDVGLAEDFFGLQSIITTKTVL